MAKEQTETNQEISAEGPKHPGGRPLKFEMVEELDRAINAYFDLCDPHTQRRVVDCGINEKGETIWREREVMTEQQPYTMSGLALAIGMTRQSLLNYKKRDEFFDTITRAKQRCEAYWEGRLDSKHDRGAAFNLTNNYDGWRNRQELTGKDGEDLGKGWADLVAQAAK